MIARLKPEYVIKQALKEARCFKESMRVVPEEVPSILRKINAGNLKLNYEISYQRDTKILIQSGVEIMALALIFLGSIIASSLFVLADQAPRVVDISLFAILCLIISLVCAVLYIYFFLERKR